MTDIYAALARISAGRTADPLKPVTVISPSHASALHLRRRLAAHGPFAAVRFETMPRVAELLGAGRLAAAGKSPLARPIGDYVASQVGLESRGALAKVNDLPGYARTLRQIFRRLRRAGVKRASDVRSQPAHGHLPEILRLYDLFRDGTSGFYDAEDLQEAAADALNSGAGGVMADLGDIYIVPPGAETDAAARLTEALRTHASSFQLLDDPAASPQQRFAITPDPASEAREVARAILTDLESGVAIDEIAVFHGADDTYGRLLREAFAATGIPSVPLPGIPLSETRAGRGVSLLCLLPDKDYSRTAMMEFLSVAPLRDWLPAGDGVVHEMATTWDNISRDAGITHGAEVWQQRLGALIAYKDSELAGLLPGENEARERVMTFQRNEAGRLGDAIAALVSRLEPLKETQPALQFIDRFKSIVSEYIDPKAEALEEVIEEIDQLGTVGAVGGSFALKSFTTALSANFDARYVRPNRLGSGVVIADYRAAPGLRFERVHLCAAYEGAFPAGPGADALIDDRTWQQLKSDFPYTEDATTRIARSKAAALRAASTAGNGVVTWSAPAYEPGATREYYPSPLMAEAYSAVIGRRVTASELRRTETAGDVLVRASSPLAVSLRGPLLDAGELAVRRAVHLRHAGLAVPALHPRSRALDMLNARRSSRFTEWDGNVAAIADGDWLPLHQKTSPTALETYAACGYRYFCRTVLRLNVVEEPDERAVMDAATRGSLIHGVLEKFFIEQQKVGRPQVGEAWTVDDLHRLMVIADEHLDDANRQGQRGLPIYAAHETRSIRADLKLFLEKDTGFRRETGAIPTDFEAAVPETQVAGVTLRGRVDRIDRAPDGTRAWVIDYKTGKAHEPPKGGPFDAGQRLQLPTYIAAASEAEHVTALYWFISQRGGFERLTYETTPELAQRFEGTIAAIMGGVHAGTFPAVPGDDDEWRDSFKNCGYCDFERICSRRRDSEFAAKGADAAMAPWSAVSEAAAIEGAQ